MNLTIRRVRELTGMAVSLDIYVDGQVLGKVAPAMSRTDICIRSSIQLAGRGSS